MAIKEQPDPEPAGVPLWFLTYSDVITLLMTFFILLLTFASTEPEQFERMQQSFFGGGGASGIVSKADSAIEQDSLVLRTRPRSSRLTTRGTETPPINSDPSNQSLSEGLQSLQEQLKRDMQTTRAIELELPALVDDAQQITAFGQAMAKKLGKHLSGNPFYVTLRVASNQEVPKAIAFGQALSATALLPTGRVGVGLRREANLDSSKVQLSFSRIWLPEEK